jgi:LPXTG-site transpeptidase (sortase) family protein
VVRTRSRKRTTGRGGLTLKASALGLALAVAGGVASARSGADVPASEGTSNGRQVSAAPFVVEPAVRLEKADGDGPPKRVRGAQAARGTPVRLVVPGLGVDAPVTGVSAPDGVLLPPSDPQVLGWWRDGALPGAARGSTLITGHTVSTGGGAFDDLETLRRGDRVRVRTTRGVLAYEVTGVTIYRKATLAEDAARVFSQSVPGRLVLITCEDWNGSTYLSNAVVFAEPLG